MQSKSKPAKWARNKAIDLSGFMPTKGETLAHMGIRGEKALEDFAAAFARYIEEHEEPPVDPLLVEARNIAASIRRYARKGALHEQCGIARKIEDGEWDDHQLVQAAHNALRRGIELGGRHD